MRQLAAHWVLMAIAGCALAACATEPPPPDPNLVPTDFKKEISDTLVQTIGDPTNIRGAFISDPVLTKVNNSERYTACVRFNARDLNQHYQGSEDHIAYFYAGHLNQLVAATPDQCGKAAYKPFPELEKLCKGKTCH